MKGGKNLRGTCGLEQGMATGCYYLHPYYETVMDHFEFATCYRQPLCALNFAMGFFSN
jgi:hypothetical protein